MIAAAALAHAHAAGLTLTASGDRLRWRGPRPPEELLAELRAHKPGLLAQLRETERRTLAVALLAAAERGAAAVALGPLDDLEAHEAAAIRAVDYTEGAAVPSPDGLLPYQVRRVKT